MARAHYRATFMLLGATVSLPAFAAPRNIDGVITLVFILGIGYFCLEAFRWTYEIPLRLDKKKVLLRRDVSPVWFYGCMVLAAVVTKEFGPGPKQFGLWKLVIYPVMWWAIWTAAYYLVITIKVKGKEKESDNA